MPLSVLTFCSRHGAPTIAPTVCLGFSDEYGSWKIICISRRSGRMAPARRCVMSRPSKMICPAVGSMSRVSMRAVVVLPQPDSPTMPRVSPRITWNETSSTLRTRPTRRLMMIPRVTGKCLVSPVTVISASEDMASVALGGLSGAVTRPPGGSGGRPG